VYKVLMVEKNINFRNNRGFSLSGVLQYPKKSSEECPLLVFVHGFTGDKEEKGLFSEAAEYFVNAGYAVLRFDMTGCGDSEGEFVDTTLKGQVKDLQAALEYICKEDSIKEKRIGLVAFSLGATISIMGFDPEKISAASFWSPALFPSEDMHPRYWTNTIQKELSTNGYLKKSNLKVGRKIINDLGEVDCTEDMKRIKTPVFLVHGKQDSKINYKSTTKGKSYFFKAKSKFIVNADHSFRSSKKVRQDLFKSTEQWFNTSLL
jgi:uncharacterized protein